MKWKLSIAACIVLLIGMATTSNAAEQNEFVIEPIFKYAFSFDGDFAEITDKSGKWGLIDKTGKVIVSLEQDSRSLHVSEDTIIVETDYLWGILDRKGNEIVKPIYENRFSFNDGIAAVYKDYKWGYIDTKGNIVIELQYENASPFVNGHAVVELEEYQSAIINLKGEIIKKFAGAQATNLFTTEQELYENYNMGDAPKTEEVYFWTVNKLNKWGIVNLNGDVIIPPTYENPSYNLKGQLADDDNWEQYRFSEGIAVVGVEWKRSLINLNGEVIANLNQFDDDPMITLSHFQGGMLGYCVVENLNKGCGFIDKSGKVAIEPKYEQAYSFSDGLAAVIVNSQWGFINTKGAFVIKPQYEAVSRFSDGIAWAQKDGLWGLIDTKGQAVTDFIYDSQQYYGEVYQFHISEGTIRASKNGQFGLLDTEGNEITEFKYAGIGYASNGMIPASLDGEKWGYIVVPDAGAKEERKNTRDIDLIDIVMKIILNRVPAS
ncbi:WG repeat-containing protein [Paenibacillus sp. L3-i20]|uniref:WG repeat-containing protein n=1 Tax=Paenibacillus sp. L3-i20 TaxID=2905833 RepID=UPI001EE095DC|nr:WG repeat-containing protein [Paenibacillus sp. L3-i20]GKU77159.1 hypothetical protein L3i20_v215560 [Paenibacillus sp. L3-i20]